MTGCPQARRELGTQLASARKAAGYTQARLAAAAGYSRSTVSNAEIGSPDVARSFFARCDQVLKTGRALTLAFDQVKAGERRRAAGLPDSVLGTGQWAFSRARQLITSGATAEAVAGYRELGWSALPAGGGLELVTGHALDALELPRAAGMLAMSLWRYSRGRPDQIRRLPALPDPATALAVITAGDRCYFLAAAGDCPWTGHEPAPAARDRAAGAVIRWHSGGGRIPAPPSRLAGGQRAAWAHLPSRSLRLVSCAALLGLLGTAAAAASQGPPGLILPGGIRVLPAGLPPGAARAPQQAAD